MAKVTLLDGGMGQELVKRSGKPASPLWSTQVMIDQPGLVAQIHQAYADAGAIVATTNSYAIHRDRLRGSAENHYAQAGDDLPDREAQFDALLEMALAEARTIRNRSFVAGSIGPLGASYRADLHPPLARAVPLYAEVAKKLAPGCDMLLFETVVSAEAIRACLEAGRQAEKPIWLSVSVDDEDGTKLRSGEALAEMIEPLAQADAVLVNCSAPEVISDTLAILAQTQRPIGAYGNGFTQITKAFLQGGTTTDDLKARRDLTPALYGDFAMEWVDHGATIIGGCCEVGPAHIAAIAERLRARGLLASYAPAP